MELFPEMAAVIEDVLCMAISGVTLVASTFAAVFLTVATLAADVWLEPDKLAESATVVLIVILEVLLLPMRLAVTEREDCDEMSDVRLLPDSEERRLLIELELMPGVVLEASKFAVRFRIAMELTSGVELAPETDAVSSMPPTNSSV